MKYVWPRMEATFQARRDAIEGGIKRAEEAQEEAQRLLERVPASSSPRRAPRRPRSGTTPGPRASGSSRRCAPPRRRSPARIVARGEEQLTVQRQQVVRELRGEIGTLATELAERVVGETLAEDRPGSGRSTGSWTTSTGWRVGAGGRRRRPPSGRIAAPERSGTGRRPSAPARRIAATRSRLLRGTGAGGCGSTGPAGCGARSADRRRRLADRRRCPAVTTRAGTARATGRAAPAAAGDGPHRRGQPRVAGRGTRARRHHRRRGPGRAGRWRTSCSP